MFKQKGLLYCQIVFSCHRDEYLTYVILLYLWSYLDFQSIVNRQVIKTAEQLTPEIILWYCHSYTSKVKQRNFIKMLFERIKSLCNCFIASCELILFFKTRFPTNFLKVTPTNQYLAPPGGLDKFTLLIKYVYVIYNLSYFLKLFEDWHFGIDEIWCLLISKEQPNVICISEIFILQLPKQIFYVKSHHEDV